MCFNRAGRYVEQLDIQHQKYRAYIPNPLPPDPKIKYDDELHELLSKADRSIGRLDGSILTLPDPDLFVFMYIRKEAVLSSQIEGTQSSLNDLLEVEAKVYRPNRPSDVNEVINYVAAMRYGLRRLDDLPLSVRLIREIHKLLLKDTRGQENNPGELRTRQNWIGTDGGPVQDAIFVPPPHNEVTDALSALERFLNDTRDRIPALIKIGLIHAQFETIHPFLDGNGRMGRLLITFFLCQREILSKPVLYLSYYLRRNREKYYEHLQKVRDESDWESWIKFFLEAVVAVADEAAKTARGIVELREKHRGLIESQCGQAAGNGLALLQSLYSKPYVSVNEVVDIVEISYQSANQLVAKFVDNDILIEITGNDRNRVFTYQAYTDLFTR